MSSFDALVRMVLIGVIAVLAGHVHAQQAYPSKPIRILVPFPPGGSNDVVGRIIGQKLAESLGVQTLLEARGGGNGIIGTDALAKSPPDGYTIMVTTMNTHLVTPLLMPTPYDAVNDFAAVATLDSSESIIVVHPSVPASNLQELVAFAKSKPGQLNYGTSTTFAYVTTVFFCMKTGIAMQHIPYKGAGPAITDLLGGQIQFVINTPGSIVTYVKSGKLRAIAVTGETRLPALPNVPTLAESGLPDFDMKGFRGVLAPRDTPKHIIDKLSAEIARIISLPDVKEKLAAQGMDPFTLTPEQFTARMKADSAKFAQIIKAANIKFE